MKTHAKKLAAFLAAGVFGSVMGAAAIADDMTKTAGESGGMDQSRGSSDSDYQAAKEKCGAMGGVDKAKCMKDANETRKSSNMMSSSPMSASDYAAGKAKCDAMTGEAMTTCMTQLQGKGKR